VSARRRILRPANNSPESQRQAQRLRKLRERLVQERTALARWMKRLRRAFAAAEKRQRAIARIEKEMARLENSA
jgi:transposase